MSYSFHFSLLNGMHVNLNELERVNFHFESDIQSVEDVVIVKVPTNFFNCSCSWPRLAGHFPLMSPSTDEAF